MIFPDASKGSEYHGLASIFEFTNDDGAFYKTNCGLAAAATFLTHHHIPAAKTRFELMALLEKEFPPDVLGGLFGVSRRRVLQIVRALHGQLDVIVGEGAIREALNEQRPVLVMLSMPQGKWLNFDLPGGHWMVAYGYDEERIYLTNHDAIPWEEFRHGWNGWIPALIGMRRRGLVMRSPSPKSNG